MTHSPIAFVDLRRQYGTLKREINEAVLEAIERGDYILGRDTDLFEKEFADFVGAPWCVGVANGTDALMLALRALDIGPGDEVIVPTNSYVSSAFAVSLVGATPVFIDCEPRTYQLDTSALASVKTQKTRAIIPVHLYGHPADMDPILDFASTHGLRVVEDAAQAHGATYKGRACGTMGDIGCFSFYPGKNLGAYGDGGAIVSKDESLIEKLQKLRNLGQEVKYKHVEIGHNSRLDTVQAALLRVKLRHLGAWNEARRRAAARYTELLAESHFVLPETAAHCDPVWHLYVVRTHARQHLMQTLAGAGISSGIHYPVPIHRQPAYAGLNIPAGSFPVAEQLADKIVSLPMFPEITDQEIQRVVEVCRSIQ